ncbi:MAG: sulfite exporter TauE/SafE family protein [Gemmatimonadaceae bacterium]|nr:sulfite exporter TauE/SafE family protein [Gemmatimonadaceae bacterium]
MPLPPLPELLQTHGLSTYPVVFAGGVLTSLTPCIYPMIPITAAVVGGARQSRGRVVALTLAYVCGLALAYAALGLIAGMTGSLFGAVSTNKWALLGVANLLLLFALTMFGVLSVPLPSSWLQRAASMDSRGRLAGAFGMGAASGLVAAPCGAPVLATLLTWVATTQSAWLGFSYLFVFSLGMSSLLVVVGLTTGGLIRLPKSGVWMLHVKHGFGVVLLIMAEYYLVQTGQVWF